MTNLRHSSILAAVIAAGMLSSIPLSASAQSTTSSMTGLKLSKDQPIQIQSDQLEVKDQEKKAYFTGNVQVVQGTTTVKAGKMTVLYKDKAAPAKGTAAGDKPAADKAAADKAAADQGTVAAAAGSSITGGNTDIDKIFLDDTVYLTSGTQQATAEKGEFDMDTQIFTLQGKQVVLSDGPNVFKGCKLTVKMDTGQANLDACGGRVEILLDPKSRPKQ